MTHLQRSIRYFTALFVLFTIATSTANAQSGASNLLQNPGFEEPASYGMKPGDGWYMNYGDANSRMTVQSSDAHSGQNCIRLDAPSLLPSNPSVTAEQVVPVKAGHSYSFRLWVKGNPVGADGLLAIVWSDKDHNWITHSGTGFAYTSDWSLQRVTGTAPRGAAFGAVRVDIRSIGVAWIDDALLYERKVTRIEPLEKSGVIAAKATCKLHWRTLDDEGLPITGAPVELKISGGDAAFVSTSGTHRTVKSDESGLVTVTIKSASKPGVVCNITAKCEDSTNRIVLRTASVGIPVKYLVEPLSYAPQPGQSVQVSVRLIGAFGEPVVIPGRRVSASLIGAEGAASAVMAANGIGILKLKAPKNLFTKFSVSVRDSKGIRGESEPIVVSPPIRKDIITLGPNGYFVDKTGKPFIPLGGLYANRVHTVSGDSCGGTISDAFTDASDEQLNQWFAYLKANGVTALRGMLRNHTKTGTEPLDIMGRVNEPLLASWEHMMSLARPYGIRFLLTVHESWYATYAAYFNKQTMENCVLKHYTPEELAALPAYRKRFLVEKRMLAQTSEPMTDPDVLACQRDYLTELIPRLRANPDIFAYEIENEQPNGYMDWSNDQIALIKRYDPITPVCISHLGGGLLDADPIPWSRKTVIDFYTYHIYPSGFQTSAERDYGTAVAVTARYSALGKPVMAGEAYGDEWYKATPEARHLGGRDCVWGQILGHNIGAFFWDTIDEPIKEFRLAKNLAERAGLGTFKPASARVGIDVSPYTDDDRRFQDGDGKKLFADMNRCATVCFQRGIDFDFTFKPKAFPISLRPSESLKLKSIKPEIELTAGWEAQYIRSEDNKHFLCYIRNMGGAVNIQADPNAGWTRSRKPAELSVKVQLPLKTQKITVVDLDTGVEQEMAFTQGTPMDLGVTDHDFALLVRE